MAAHTKTQLRTLAGLRTMLRHVATHVDNRVGEPPVRDVTSFQRFIVAQYRAGAPVTDRSEAKRLRMYAEDMLSYFSALAAQSALITRYRGGDPDTSSSRRAAARFVGLEMPATPLPLAPPAAAGADASAATPAPAGTPRTAAQRYAAAITARVGDVSKLEGVENLKAQLYGAPGAAPAFTPRAPPAAHGAHGGAARPAAQPAAAPTPGGGCGADTPRR